MWVRAINNTFTVDGHYRKAGEEFEYSGPKNENLKSVKKLKADAEEEAAANEGQTAEQLTNQS